MPTTIQIPEKISRATVIEFIESLGLIPHDVKGLTFTPNILFVEVIKRDENGDKFEDPYTPNQWAQATLKIPIA